MDLYLCRFSLRIYEYMEGDHVETDHIRLVEASCEEDARERLKEHVEVKDPYARSVYLERVEIYGVIR